MSRLPNRRPIIMDAPGVDLAVPAGPTTGGTPSRRGGGTPGNGGPRSRLRLACLLGVAAIGAVPSVGHAYDYYWTGAGTTANWTNGFNWVGSSLGYPGPPNGYEDNVYFESGVTRTTCVVNETKIVDTFRFRSTTGNPYAFTFNAQNNAYLILGAIVNRTSATQTFNVPIEFDFGQTKNVIDNRDGDESFGGGKMTFNSMVTGDVFVYAKAGSTIEFNGNVDGNRFVESSGTVRLAGNNSGGLYIAAGTVKYSNSANLGSEVVISNSATLERTASGTDEPAPEGSGFYDHILLSNGEARFVTALDWTMNRNFIGRGTLVKAGPGTFTLGGALGYTGPTNLYEGTLALNGVADLPDSKFTSAAGTTFRANPTIDTGVGEVDLAGAVYLPAGRKLTVGTAASNSSSIRGVVSGPGGLTLNAGTLALTAANTYTGPTEVLGGTLTLGGTSASKSFSVAADATLGLQPATDTDYGTTTFSGGYGTLRKTGAGRAGWGGSAATFALGSGSLIDVQQGEFVGGSYANENWTANLSRLNVATGAIFSGTEANVRVDALTGGGTVKTGLNGAGYNSFTVGVDNGTGAFSGTIADTDAANRGRLTKEGAGTQTLSGANTYSGGTVVSGGTLRLVGNGTLGSGGIVNNATLDIGRTADLTIAGGISGTGTLTHSGIGTTTLTADQTYTGPTKVTAGTLKVQRNIASTAISVDGGGTLELSPAFQVSYGPTSFSGTGTLRKTGTSQANFGGNTATFAFGSGALIDVQAGELYAPYANADAWTNNKSDLSVAAGASFRSTTNVRVDALTGGGTVFTGSLIGNAVFAVGVDNGSGTFGGVIANGTLATGKVTKVGTGTQTLTNANTYTGPTVVNAGTLKLQGVSASSGFAVAGGAELEFASASTTDHKSTTFTGTGTLRKTGVGTTHWGAGAANFNFGTNALIDVQAGTLVGGSSNNEVWTNNLADLTVAAGATFSGVEANVRVDALRGGGTVLTGYTPGATGYASFTVGVDGNSTEFVTGFSTFSGTIADTAATGTPGRLTKVGTGTQALTGANTYTGGTTVAGGTLILGDFLTSGTLSPSGTIDIQSAGEFVITGPNAIVQGTGFGTITGSGTFYKSGGTVTLTAANPFTGQTIVGGGTLQIGNGGTAGSLTAAKPVTVEAGAVFAVNRSDGVTQGVQFGTITGAGSFTQAGTGTTTLVNANTYTNATIINAGTLQLGDGTSGHDGTLATARVTNRGTLVFNRFGTDTAAYPISGAGTVVKAGAGTQTLTGANTYTGPTVVAAGTLRAASAASVNALLNVTSGVDLAAGATLELAYAAGGSPLAAVESILDAGYQQTSKFSAGRLRSSTLAAGRTIGYGDSGGVVTVRVTLPGDADLDRDVDFNDFILLQANFGGSDKRFDQGNFDYDAVTDFNDFILLQSNFGGSLTGAKPAISREQYAAVMGITHASQVPEPAALSAIGLGLAGLLRRRRSTRNAVAG